jgi:hypothetical protein
VAEPRNAVISAAEAGETKRRRFKKTPTIEICALVCMTKD